MTVSFAGAASAAVAVMLFCSSATADACKKYDEGFFFVQFERAGVIQEYRLSSEKLDLKLSIGFHGAMADLSCRKCQPPFAGAVRLSAADELPARATDDLEAFAQTVWPSRRIYQGSRSRSTSVQNAFRVGQLEGSVSRFVVNGRKGVDETVFVFAASDECMAMAGVFVGEENMEVSYIAENLQFLKISQVEPGSTRRLYEGPHDKQPAAERPKRDPLPLRPFTVEDLRTVLGFPPR